MQPKANSSQKMMSRNISTDQNKEWSGEPLIHVRDYPKSFVKLAGGTYESYVWVIERKLDRSCNVNFVE